MVVGDALGSSRAAPPGWRSAGASRPAGRRSSSRRGSTRRPGSPGTSSRARCRRRRRFFSSTTTSTPAWCSRWAATSPDMPAPMTATRKGRSGATSSLRQAGGAEVLPERQLVAQQLEVVVAGRTAGDEGEQRRELVERERTHRAAGAGSRSRWSAARASARPSSSCAADSPKVGSISTERSGRRWSGASVRSPRSPASAASRGGSTASSSAAAIESSSESARGAVEVRHRPGILASTARAGSVRRGSARSAPRRHRWSR